MNLFNFRGDRSVVELTIEFNLAVIDKWLSSGASEKVAAREYWDFIENLKKEDWEVHTQSYHIDVLPNGQSSDMYFHRKKSIISNQIDGFEANSEKTRWFSHKIEILEWSYWNQFLNLQVNNKSVLLVPLTEFAELQAFGKLKNLTRSRETEKIKVPIRFAPKSSQPIDFTEVIRTISHPQGVGYENALASVYAQTSGLLGRTIEY